MPARHVIAVLAAILVGGSACQSAAHSAPSATPSVSSKASRSPQPTPTLKPLVAPRPTDIPTDGACESQVPCLGLLKPGITYRTRAFIPTITLKVPAADWENLADTGGDLVLNRLGRPGDVLAFFGEPNALNAAGKIEPGVSGSVDSLVAWITAYDQLEVTKPMATAVGGLKGMVMDLKVAAGATATDDECPTRICVPIFHGGAQTWAWDWSLTQAETARLYLLAAKDRVIAIFVDSLDGTTQEALNKDAAPVLAGVKFG